jgi:hypothetical protein
MEVRGQRLGVKLPRHHRDLTSMVSGMVRQMLHEVYQCDFELNPMQSRGGHDAALCGVGRYRECTSLREQHRRLDKEQ